VAEGQARLNCCRQLARLNVARGEEKRPTGEGQAGRLKRNREIVVTSQGRGTRGGEENREKGRRQARYTEQC
jgi:hypothetical protein